MKKRQKRKEKQLVRGMAAAAITAIITTAGCVPQTDIPIVSEKREETREAPGQSWEETEEGEGKAKEERTKGKKTKEEKAEEEKTKEEKEFDLKTIRERAQVPELYKADIREENITITADVKVEVPETGRIPLMEMEYLPRYTDEELEKMKEVLGQELGVAEWEERLGDGHQTYESPDHVYTLSLVSGEGQGTPIVWLSCPGISDGAGRAGDLEDLSPSSLTEDDRKKIQSEVEKKAENLLRKMGLEDFCLEKVQWRQLAVSRNSSWSLSGEQGIRLYYWRSVEGMPVISRGKKDSSWGDRTQYVEFLYKEDGTLLEVKNIGRERVTGMSEYAESLLPFLEISQIFEQCMKTAETDRKIGVAGAEDYGTGMEDYVPAQRAPVLMEDHPGVKRHIYLTVTEVKLVYRAEYENQDSAELQKNGGKGKSIPVWAFYGIPERGYENQNGTEAEIPRTSLSGGKTRLLMVNAEDGTIYWR